MLQHTAQLHMLCCYHGNHVWLSCFPIYCFEDRTKTWLGQHMPEDHRQSSDWEIYYVSEMWQLCYSIVLQIQCCKMFVNLNCSSSWSPTSSIFSFWLGLGQIPFLNWMWTSEAALSRLYRCNKKRHCQDMVNVPLRKDMVNVI